MKKIVFIGSLFLCGCYNTPPTHIIINPPSHHYHPSKFHKHHKKMPKLNPSEPRLPQPESTSH
jgi:hypothetical protein